MSTLHIIAIAAGTVLLLLALGFVAWFIHALIDSYRQQNRWAALSPEQRRRAKLLILGAGAGSALKPDEDGVIRVEEIPGDDEA